jgi:SNF2 family DNA or RNA helicase
MFDCFQRSRNAILGDEMGLGKTAQTLAFLECKLLFSVWLCSLAARCD